MVSFKYDGRIITNKHKYIITMNKTTKNTASVSNDGEIFDDQNRLARDMADGWFKFEKPGDKVGGTIKDMWEQPERDGMPAQRCFTLEENDGSLTNVGLKRTGYILSRTDMLQIGDMLGVKFEKEIPPKKKGFHPAKSLIIFSKLIGPRQGMSAKDLVPVEPTQEEVEAEDKVDTDFNNM